MNDPIRVVLADDHGLILEGLRSLLAFEPDILVLATATDGERLLEAVHRFRPDVVIADIRMPYLDGVSCVAKIRAINPATRILLLTAYTDDETLRAAMDTQTDGLLLKTDSPALITQAIRQVMGGQLVFPGVVRRWLFSSEKKQPHSPLSDREIEVISLAAEGLTNAQIAHRLNLSVNTVKFHLQNIYQQLGVTNRTEASRIFLENHSS